MIENANEQTVAQLVAAAIDGDARSWNGIVPRYDALVRAVVVSYRMQPADNEDAVQSTWLRAVERIHTLRQAECLPAWLATVARRECLALLTRTRRERPDSEA